MLIKNNNTYIAELNFQEFFVSDTLTLTTHLPGWVVFSLTLYYIGLLGMIFNYKNFIITMMSVELMYLGAVSSFVLYGAICQDPRGYIYGLLLLILAACESAIGLGLLIIIYRFDQSIAFTSFEDLGG